MSKGKVKWFNEVKGFGFIAPDDSSKELFVHYSEIKNTGDFVNLKEGQCVEFVVGKSPKGPCANNVVAL
jgi:CspA family cold shock protein